MVESCGPLSWDEARSSLRETLKSHLDYSTSNNENDPLLPVEKYRRESSLCSRIIVNDLDVYVGAILLSITLLVLASLSLTGTLPNDANEPFEGSRKRITLLRSELAGATVLVASAIINSWVIRRRRFLKRNDKESAKRREIHKFLRCDPNGDNSFDKENVSRTDAGRHQDLTVDDCVPCQLTSLNEVYLVFRIIGNSAAWSSIPSLLLVKGDWIALQVGDIAPATCVTMTKNKVERKIFYAGERITIESLGSSSDDMTVNLAPGRTTLPSNSSNSFLTLCNNMQICEVIDSPIISSLNRKSVSPPSSLISRQVTAIREILSFVSLLIFIVSSVILFSRRKITMTDISTTVSLPILATLGMLPIIGPAYIFGLEVLGTARILTAVHPYASITQENNENESNTRLLLIRYIIATGLSRLSLWPFVDAYQRCFRRFRKQASTRRAKLIRIPPASTHLLEKLGVATAFALVDDELACEPQSIPQQLLIPSAKGLKLLDLCPAQDTEDDGDESEHEDDGSIQRQRGKSFDSDSDSDESVSRQISLRRKGLPKRLRRFKVRGSSDQNRPDEQSSQDVSRFDVQFEEPDWWHFLPSLKCIGLTCLLHDEGSSSDDSTNHRLNETEFDRAAASSLPSGYTDIARDTLSSGVLCHERQSKQLVSLAECIGFSKENNSSGRRGDISVFTERLRLHVVSNQLFKERLVLDSHERSSEQSRWWGLLRPDLTAMIVQDNRTNAFQVLSVGDPVCVCNLCNEAWQGEISTILPFAASDKRTIIETTNAWKLADLDVTAFSYAPVPRILEPILSLNRESRQYLFDHTEKATSAAREKGITNDWSFLGNQIFLGVLGSLVIPRREIRKLLDILNEAGVRFVYFSPRNMRRQKELAIQMGIDVAWNCAISLRPLESGKDDPHRMVSNYADWDVNAKLPHGVCDVRKHLEEVDNVPLLVSLFTDSTKETTKEMVEIFQEYDDTVVSVGLSHLTRNEGIFACADVAVGIDILTETKYYNNNSMLHVFKSELEFVQSIASQSCAFRLRGASSVASISTIIEKSRAALDAAVSSARFLIFGSTSYSLYVLFSICSPATVIPYVPTVGTALYLLFLLPIVGLSMELTDGEPANMKRVPVKNDRTITLLRKERMTYLTMDLAKAVFPALLPQILHLIGLGALVLKFDADFVQTHCPMSSTWVDIVRCDGMKNYSGVAKSSAGSLVLAQFILCVVVSSAAFIHRFYSISEQLPWYRNTLWLVSVSFACLVLVLYVAMSTESGTIAALPWYFFVTSFITPLISVVWVELFKRSETKQEQRAEKVRRLQFETRLGAWSPR